MARRYTATEYREETPVQYEEAHAHAGESEVVETHAGPFDMARGWVRFTQSLVAFALLLVETLLSFRLVFALTGANPENGFVDFIYDITRPLVAPFEGIANERVIDGESVFEPETVIAMMVYFVAAVLVIALLNVIMSAPGPEQHTINRSRDTHVDRHA
jgi:hypothetical protein